mgnify:FL=1
MMGLIKKDVYLSLSMLKSYVVVAAVFALLTMTGIYDISFFVTYLSVMCIMIPVNLFAYDEQARWDKYAAALPAGRAGMVKARYLFTILICFGTLGFALLLQLIVALFTGVQGQERTDLLLSGLLPTAYGIFMNAVLLPLLFKFGSQKGRIYLILALGVGVGVIFGGLTGLKKMGIPLSALTVPFFALPVAGLLVLMPSYLLSKRILFQKDL